MKSSLFHPAVAAWFGRTFAAPTPAQAQAWPAIQAGRPVLIAAPTGSGKTLAAFLAAIDALVRQGLADGLKDETQVVYVSPLKALSNDIRKSLEQPLAGIREELLARGLPEAEIRTLVRSGDTPAAERTRMFRRPPHIVVTTPESLYILLGSESGRKMLATTRTVIVDEIHALAPNKRGAHLALSLERLAVLAGGSLQRVGLSATQKPIEEVARFLVGAGPDGEQAGECAIVDSGHRRERDLALEVPASPLEAVMSNEVWEQVYDRLTELIAAHRTTLIFVNTRRMAERLTRHLSERLGEERIAAHHGSLAKEHRLAAEQRLKNGELSALVATASLELGIDIGEVDLVCQLSSPHSIASFLQRVGRAGHGVGGTPKGRLFPLSRDELVECAALLDAVRRGELDRLAVPDKPLDVLAQQIVAETAAQDWEEDALYACFRRAWPYRDLPREAYAEILRMLAEGYSTRRGRHGALIHHDAVNHVVRGRRGARLTALTSGGTIPDTADYQVLLEPENHVIGTVNEDFAVESLAGDVFQLGNNSYRILRVERGTVRVEDAHGLAPSIPFWLGEAPGRSDELSHAVSRLRSEIAARLENPVGQVAATPLPDAPYDSRPPLSGSAKAQPDLRLPDGRTRGSGLPAAIRGRRPLPPDPAVAEANADPDAALRWLIDEVGLSEPAAQQLFDYLAAAHAALGCLPTLETLVMERFFDEAGGMQLVIHSPYGSRLNRAWGLTLRKRFCRKFNFELQAAATEDNIVLSLTTAHSFALDEVPRYLHSATARQLLVQALLAAPMFITRWRWTAAIALALPRFRGGKKVPPQFMRMDAEDLIAAIFPDQIACAENLAGEREIPDHPLVAQTLADCLHEAMDTAGFERLLAGIETGAIRVETRDLTEPSPLALEVLSARPYAYLDDAPLEERRTQAVMGRRWLDPEEAADIGRLDPEAIARVREEAWPDAANADELHDALVWLSFLTEEEAAARAGWEEWLGALARERRATRLCTDRSAVWIAAERLPDFQALFREARPNPPIAPPAGYEAADVSPETALIEILRGRLEGLGPASAETLAAPLGLPPAAIAAALAALETEGFALRGRYTPGAASDEWCERRLLARIHRYTVKRLRAEIEPVAARDFLRFLLDWQHVAADTRLEGPDAVAAVVALLEGFEAPAGAWETELLAARIAEYEPSWLDDQCLAGRVSWARLSPPASRSAPPAPAFRTARAPHRAPLPPGEGLGVKEAPGEGLEVRQTRGPGLGVREAPGKAPGSRDAPGQGLGVKETSGEGMAARETPGEASAAKETNPERTAHAAGPVRTTPLVLLPRRHARLWAALAGPPDAGNLSPRAQRVLAAVREHGASFFEELVEATGLLRTQVEEALAELVAVGVLTSDSFAGLRVLLLPSEKRKPVTGARRRHRTALFGMEDAGRWALARRTPAGVPSPLAGTLAGTASSLAVPGFSSSPGPRPALPSPPAPLPGGEGRDERPAPFVKLERLAPSGNLAVEHAARTLLRRYGVVFWRLLEREARWLPPWRDLLRCYRRLEARGEIRGGRFVAGFSGEQFALPEAIGLLRETRRKARASGAAPPPDDRPAGQPRGTTEPGDWISLSAADPLNLVGILTPGGRLPALTGNRLLYRDGLPVAVLAAGEVRFLEALPAAEEWAARNALLRRALPAALADFS